MSTPDTLTTPDDVIDIGYHADDLGRADGQWVAEPIARAVGLPLPPQRTAIAVAPPDSLVIRVREPDTASAVGPVGAVGIDTAVIVSGTLRVSAGDGDAVIVIGETASGPAVFRAPSAARRIPIGTDLAGDPLCALVFDRTTITETRPVPSRIVEDIRLQWAAMRALAIAGAAQRCAEMTVQHTATRRQFGRTLDHFQAVKQNEALLLEEVALVSTAVRGATPAVREFGRRSWTRGERTAVMSAVVGANASVGDIARVSHQLHGAVGFTELSDLHHFTTRLWAWREAITDEWARRLGTTAIDAGGSGVWNLVTTTTASGTTETARQDAAEQESPKQVAYGEKETSDERR